MLSALLFRAQNNFLVAFEGPRSAWRAAVAWTAGWYTMSLNHVFHVQEHERSDWHGNPLLRLSRRCRCVHRLGCTCSPAGVQSLIFSCSTITTGIQQPMHLAEHEVAGWAAQSSAPCLPADPGTAMLQQWEQFAARQAQRAIAHSPQGRLRRRLLTPAAYRLHLAVVDGVPMYKAPGRRFEFRLGVTLCDEELGHFYGCTCFGQPVAFTGQAGR